MSSSKKEPIILTKENSNNQIIEITAYHLQDLSAVEKAPNLCKLNLIGGTGNILYVSGSVNDIYTKGTLMNATVSKSIVNIIAKNMPGANTFDLLKNNINNKIGFTNYNFSVTNNTASHKIVDKTLTVFIYGGYIGSNNKVYSFYGCVSYNSCKIECESSNAIFSVTNGILTVADSTGLYLCNAKVLDTVYTG